VSPAHRPSNEPSSEPSSDASGTWHYGLIARWWAEFNEPEPQELAYYRSAIERFGGPALDLACGTGRLLLPLLGAGLDVDGVDISPDMLALAGAKARQSGLQPTLIAQAMHELDLARTYGTIYICDSFGIGGRRDRDLETLRRIHRHLAPRGALVFSQEMPYDGRDEASWARWLAGHRDDLPRPWRPATSADRRATADGDEIELVSRLGALDPLAGVERLEMRARLWRGGSIVTEEERSLLACIYFAPEVVGMLRWAGFEDVTVEGRYTGRPATGDDGTVVFVARRAKDPGRSGPGGHRHAPGRPPRPVPVVAGGPHEVLEQDGVRHRTDAAGDGRDGRDDRRGAGEVNVADDAALHHVDAHVDDDRAPLQHRAADEAGPAGGGDDDVGPLRVRGEVARPRVADRDRAVLAQQQQGRRLADDVAATDHHGVAAGEGDARALQHLHRGLGGGRQEAIVTQLHEAGVARVQTVDVLARGDRVDDRAERDPLGQRHLDDDPGDGRIGVQRLDLGAQVGRRRARRQVHEPADRAGGAARAQDLLQIDGRGRVTAHEDDRQRRRRAEAAAQRFDLQLHLRPDLGGDRPPQEQPR
jgi:SAM-dependent methyltransferase